MEIPARWREGTTADLMMASQVVREKQVTRRECSTLFTHDAEKVQRACDLGQEVVQMRRPKVVEISARWLI